ncbi:MAG: hypothetical protein LBJ86_07565 [Spirochaetaceae bacterium]|jgi:hypothetical protein|nr:hypothetical protein [Spirochaetaceae bacterium]
MKNYIFYGFALAALTLAPIGVSAQKYNTDAVPAGTDLSALKFDTPVIIDSDVVFADSDNKWIAMSADVQAITQVPIEKMYAVLHDLANQPNVFNKGVSKTKSVVIKSSRPDGVTAEFTTTAVGQDTTYTALVTENLNLPDSALITVKQTEPNAQIRNVYATWYVASMTVNGAKCTYIRFYDSNEAAGGAIKKGLVNAGINGAHTSTIKQLIDGARNR